MSRMEDFEPKRQLEPKGYGPNAFGSITMSLTNCARGPPRTMKSPSLLFRWSLFATMITTWIDTLVEKHIPSHWLWLDIAPGVYKLWALCRDHPAAGFPAARDEAPLRLVSWLSFQLSQRCQVFIQAAMDMLCSPQSADLLVEGRKAFFFCSQAASDLEDTGSP